MLNGTEGYIMSLEVGIKELEDEIERIKEIITKSLEISKKIRLVCVHKPNKNDRMVFDELNHVIGLMEKEKTRRPVQ